MSRSTVCFFFISK